MIDLDFKINDDYHLDINGLYQVRRFEDGISFFELSLKLDTYKGDHNPQVGIMLIILNFNVLEIRVYNIHHVETLTNKEVIVRCPKCDEKMQIRID